MGKLEDLRTLVRLLKEFELPMSPILEYAIREKEESLLSGVGETASDSSLYADEEPVSPIEEYVAHESIKDSFRNYLYSEKSAKTALNYLRYIDKPIRKYIAAVVDNTADSIYSYQTVEDVNKCILKLKSDNGFTSDNLRWHNALTAALTSYVRFLEMKEIL